MTDPILFKIFLSSPGDVLQERDDAQAVVDEINATGEFGHHFILKLYRWDDPTVVLPMPATNTPQESVDIYMLRPSECHLVVVLFWSRMGSPLTMDQREYLSGTHYEYLEALHGYEQHGEPIIWLYRCAEEPFIGLKDPKHDEKKQQFDRVEQFFKQFQDSEGRYTGGVNEYITHPDFKTLFKKQLLTYLRHLRDNPTASPPRPRKPRFTGVPYRGLTALDEMDTPIFFGREAEKLEVLSRVESKRLVFVLGASGSGKSSLVAAGVLPILRNRDWRVVRCVPTEKPFESLAKALVSQIPEFGIKPIDYLSEAAKLAQTLQAAPQNLVEQLALMLPKQPVLVFIDQFEEVFTLADKNPDLPAGTVADFIQCLRHPSPHVKTLLTMRADFYGVALPHFEELKQQAYGLTRPSPMALYEMITRPAELAELALDGGLAQDMIAEVGTASGGLALIAYVLQALYEAALERGDNRLSRADYEALGGVEGAINTLADDAYQALGWAEAQKKAVLQRVFRELIALTEEDGQLIPTRRRAPLSTFPPDSDETRLIDQFVKARLLVKDSAGVEVAHEAILRHWQTLANWIVTIKGDLALYRQYERDARLWDERRRDTPPPKHEALVYFYEALANLELTWARLPEPLKAYTEAEGWRLARQLEILSPEPATELTRVEIGDRLGIIGDPRLGVGVVDGIPDMVWLPVEGSNGTFKFGFGEFTVPSFFIAQSLTTYAQYQTFVEADDGYQNPDWWRDMPEKHQRQKLSDQRTKSPNNPRDSISWYQSVAFTRWLNHRLTGLVIPNPQALNIQAGVSVSELLSGQYSGAVPPQESGWVIGKTAEIRLPTEWEWQWAAQNGEEAREYPWGPWRPGHADTSESGLGRAIAVGMYPHGAAVCGALDMSGNLYEWCLNKSDPAEFTKVDNTGNSRVLRGGAFSDHQNLAACAYRIYSLPHAGSYWFGVRVVVAPPMP